MIEVVNFNAGRGHNIDRLYATTQGKFATYKQLAHDQQVPYIVGIYGDFFADVEPEEMTEVLFHPETGLFSAYPEVSGVLFFVVSVSRYLVTYYSNPDAARPFVVPSGVF